jgi:hypothetical protein
VGRDPRARRRPRPARQESVPSAHARRSRLNFSRGLRTRFAERIPKGYCFFLTNLARATHGPLQVGDIYRVRWEIEIDNKLDKTGARIDAITARKPVSVHILVLASLINSVLARTIVQREKLAIVATEAKGTRPPLHPIQTVRVMSFCHQLLLKTMQEERVSDAEWRKVMSRMRALGHDPNWRRRPSVLDTIQGLTGAPQPRRVKGKKLPTSSAN